MNQKQGFAVFALRSGKVNGMRGSLLPASSSRRLLAAPPRGGLYL